MWRRFELIFELESPLHIGYLPSKGNVVALTRRYVSGRNFWGALTKRATECLFTQLNGEKYREIGEQVKENFRFSHFYIFDGETVYHPRYDKEGLVYGYKADIPAEAFDHRFIGSRAVTAIDGGTGTAKDESLHEIEFIKHIYKDSKGRLRHTQIIGAIWIKDSAQLPSESGSKQIEMGYNGIYTNGENLLEGLIVGGEQNYGFGRIKLCEIIENGKRLPIDSEVVGNEINIMLEENKPPLFHVLIDNYLDGKIKYFKGDIELLGGRGFIKEKQGPNMNRQRMESPGKEIMPLKYCFAPGTVFAGIEQKLTFTLEYDGTLK